MFKISTNTNKQHFILLFLQVLSIIVTNNRNCVQLSEKYLGVFWQIFCHLVHLLLTLISFTLSLLLIHVRCSKLIARSNPMKGRQLPPTKGIIQGFLMDCCTIITWRGWLFCFNQTSKTDLQISKISCAENFLFVHM